MLCFVLATCGGAPVTQVCTQELLWQTLGTIWGVGDRCELVTYKANVLPAVLQLWPCKFLKVKKNITYLVI